MCTWQLDTMLPRDGVSINPCFRHSAEIVEGSPDWQTLADDLAAGIKGWEVNPASHQLQVRLYKIGEPPINRPKAIKVLNAGVSTATMVPREVAVCLSFYGGNNAPRNRGRLYLPFAKVSSSSGPDLRPSTTIRDKVAALAPIFAGLGGVNVDWIVWSPTNGAATKVTNYFVDDEYDTQRRRGLRPTTRTSGTTSG